MKTLGLIGGTTWLSTIDYYRIINQKTNELMGGLNSAKILLYSVNFEEFRPPVIPSEWGDLSEKFTAIAKNLEKAGADCIVFCANTPHIVADDVQQNIDIPIIHIAEAVEAKITGWHMKKVALLGTRITMEQDFFKNKLTQKDIEVLVPGEEDRHFLHDSIFKELAKGIFTAETKARFISIINGLIAQGAEGVILGCTEFPLLIKQEDCTVPIFDTTDIHANAAVKFALGLNRD
jgi:aspartate racemase